jgi:hypothetical protein
VLPSGAHRPSAVASQMTIENYELRCRVDIGTLVPIQSDEEEEEEDEEDDDDGEEEDEASSTSLLVWCCFRGKVTCKRRI